MAPTAGKRVIAWKTAPSRALRSSIGVGSSCGKRERHWICAHISSKWSERNNCCNGRGDDWAHSGGIQKEQRNRIKNCFLKTRIWMLLINDVICSEILKNVVKNVARMCGNFPPFIFLTLTPMWCWYILRLLQSCMQRNLGIWSVGNLCLLTTASSAVVTVKHGVAQHCLLVFVAWVHTCKHI